MTMIVDPKHFASKAKLQEALNSAKGVYIEDPSLFSGNQSGWSYAKSNGFKGVVTNHPLRTKFAQIEKLADGTWRVK